MEIKNLPNWTKGKAIYVIAGRELLAQKIPVTYFDKEQKHHIAKIDIPLLVKLDDGRCNGCENHKEMSCCATGGSPFSKERLLEIQKRLANYTFSTTGKCPLLDDLHGCIMGGSIPFSCLKSNCEGWNKYCTEKLVEMND